MIVSPFYNFKQFQIELMNELFSLNSITCLILFALFIYYGHKNIQRIIVN